MPAAWIGAAAAGAGALSSIFGGGGTSSSTQNSGPWGPQQPYLEDLYGRAQTDMQGRMASGPYTGNFYSPINGAQTTGSNLASTYGTQLGNPLAYTTGFMGQNLMASAPGYQQAADNLVSNGLDLSAPGLSGALTSAGVAGAKGINSIIQQATTDPSKALASGASTIMGSAPVNSALQATNAGIDQTLNEQTLPGLDRQAAMGGSLNSSRAGMADAMAQEGAGIAKGSADASIESNAFNSGLNAETQARNSNLMAGQWASNGAMGSALSGAMDNSNVRLNANSQIGNSVGMGLSAVGDSANLANQNLGLMEGAGSVLQNDSNQSLANNYQKWGMANNYTNNVLKDYSGLITGNVGSSATGTQTMASSPLSNALGTAAMMGSPGNSGGGWFGPNSMAGSIANYFSPGSGQMTGYTGYSGNAPMQGNTAASVYDYQPVA